jgi:hypothetical protein
MGHHTTFSALSLVTVTMVLAAASSVVGGRTQASPPGPLVFLTRDGCANTATMRTRLDAALDRLGVPTDYAVIDVDTLADRDARRGYGTPTVLYKNRDLFGMPEPTPPIPSPT